MFENFTLADIKGAPISIMVFLSLNGNRAVSVSELAAETGFSEKPIRKGLRDLQCLGMVVSPRVNRYQLTGQEYQLPLSWGEKVLPSGDSPELSGVFPGKAGVSPELERRVLRLEAAVFGTSEDDGDSPMKGQSQIPGDSPLIEEEDGENLPDIEVIPGEEWSGNFPGKLDPFNRTDGNRQKSAGSSVIRGQWASGDSAGKAGVSSEKTGDIPDGLINNINNTQDKEVSKKVGNDTYLLSNISNEQGLTVGSGDSPVKGQSPVDGMAMMHWDAAMVQMKALMDRSTFALMLQEAEVIGYEDGHYTVAVKNAQIRDWVDQRCRETIERILNGMSMNAGVQQSVSFVVEDPKMPEGLSKRGRREWFWNLSDEQKAALKEAEDRRDDATLALVHGEGELVEICNEYLADPVGIEYTVEQMEELIAMNPDPRVLRFSLGKATSFERAKVWCGLEYQKAKRHLLKNYGIYNPERERIAENKGITLELIEQVRNEMPEEMTEEEKKIFIWRVKNLADEQ